jgi:preprotein translocase subunit SecG
LATPKQKHGGYFFLDKVASCALNFQTVAALECFGGNSGEGTMKRVTFTIALVLMSISVCLCCKNNAKKNNGQKMPTQIEIETAKATIENLMPNFTCHKIEFTQKKSYHHNSRYGNIHPLEFLVNNPYSSIGSIQVFIYENSLSCSSEFWSNSRLNHKEISVNIDGKILTATATDLDDRNHIRPEYLKIQKNDIPYFIATNPNREVKVRLRNGDKHFDYTLDKIHQEAICQTVELCDALMILEAAGIDPQTGEKVKQDDFFSDRSP